MSDIEAIELSPHDTASEQGLLGCLLIDRAGTLPKCEGALDPVAFFDPRHRIVYEEIVEMANTGVPVDVVTLCQRLGGKAKLEQAGGMAYVSALQDAAGGAGNAGYFIEVILDKQNRRKLLSIAAWLKDQSRGSGDITEVVSSAEKRLGQLTQGPGSDHESLADIAAAAVERWADIASGKPRKGIPFLIPGVGHKIRWADGHRFVVVGARPSVGKSSVLLHVADEAAKEGYPVGFVSLEMPTEEVFDRLCARETGIPYKRISEGATNDTEKALLIGALERTKGRPLHLIAKPLTLPQLESEARRLVGCHGIKALCVDYLGLIRQSGGVAKLYEHVTAVSQGLKAIAMTHGIPVIAAAQLNRESENAGREPQLCDLRDSGSIEQDADVVLLLSENSDRPDELTINLAKQRGGERGKCQTRFDRATCQFSLTDA